MVLGHPEYASDASFLLSFCATLGICVFSDAGNERLSLVPAGFSFRETLAGTLSATVATLPVTAGMF